MWICVHPYKATHFKNLKSILHFIAFMVLHTDYYHNDHINHRISIAWFLVWMLLLLRYVLLQLRIGFNDSAFIFFQIQQILGSIFIFFSFTTGHFVCVYFSRKLIFKFLLAQFSVVVSVALIAHCNSTRWLVSLILRFISRFEAIGFSLQPNIGFTLGRDWAFIDFRPT